MVLDFCVTVLGTWTNPPHLSTSQASSRNAPYLSELCQFRLTETSCFGRSPAVHNLFIVNGEQKAHLYVIMYDFLYEGKEVE